MAQEKRFENKIKDYIKSVGGRPFKWFGNAYSESGVPDILACINGQFVAIEVKAQYGKVSELQMVKIKEIKAAGGFAYVVYPSGWDQLKAIIDGILIDDFNREEEVILK